MANLGTDTRLSRKASQVFSEVDGQVVMLNVKKEAYYWLNDVGSAIWKEIEQPCTFGELISRLESAFDVARDECIKDVEPFLRELVQSGVVELDNE